MNIRIIVCVTSVTYRHVVNKGRGNRNIIVNPDPDRPADSFLKSALRWKGVQGPYLRYEHLGFLISELQAACILKYKAAHPDGQTSAGETELEQRVEEPSHKYTESCQSLEDCEDIGMKRAEMSAEFALLLQALDMEASSQYVIVLQEVERRIAQLPCKDMIGSLLNASLNSEQWRQVEKINDLLLREYACRRQMMVKRFEVTLQSFAWGDKQKGYDQILSTVPPLSSLAPSSQVSMSLLLATRQDQSCIMPVKAGLSTAVYKVQMGSVPDRGGRPGEIEPPMPGWEGRREKGKGSARGGGQNKQRRKFSEKKKGKRE
ncbi:hypothetical protein NHX12_008921 [Muraenolepis orangiensis]|uniref:Uncharacterized protein n=1 Tax=Muraenolepis orangiensis TaxID=630683 RepID=A0A9Q0DP12_9TELE|nr:hypothetical protein NHX12_008921 [Muraenolepis orangiensis]